MTTRTAYKPLVAAIAATSGDILTALDYAKQAFRDYPHYANYEQKQGRIRDIENAQRAVRSCRDATYGSTK